MPRASLAISTLAIVGALVFWVLTIPHPVPSTELTRVIALHPPNSQNGERIFHLGGCASCHAAKDAKGPARLILLGGQALVTPFGTFRVPNISPDAATGIGQWSIANIVTAVVSGVSPDGRHYYPAFPYASYSGLSLADAVDLAGYLKTLPASNHDVSPHDLKFPFNIRRGIGLWKLLYVGPRPLVQLTHPTDAVKRGQYIVEGPGHCGECHTPRNPIGGPIMSRWLAGAPVLDGTGHVPDITPAWNALGAWSASDITYFLEMGLTPDGDSVGGAMTDVVENLAAASDDDRAAIAAYLKAIPPLPEEPKPARKPSGL